MSSNKMSFLEPVPLGTWQSSVLISVKLLTFQVDVRFFWQGSVLINVTSFCTCGHFGLKWHPPRNFVHRFMQRRGTPGHRGATATSSFIVLGHQSKPFFSISSCGSVLLGFWTGISVLVGLVLPGLDE
jgi:hypothetical protein